VSALLHVHTITDLRISSEHPWAQHTDSDDAGSVDGQQYDQHPWAQSSDGGGSESADEEDGGSADGACIVSATIRALAHSPFSTASLTLES
jgi:hypothetical protein